jgi:regulator of sirC expression with transglutaminase-like and TPR domain
VETLSALDRFTQLADLPDQQIDLALGALLIAAHTGPDVDVDEQLALLDSLAAAVHDRIPVADEPLAKINVLNDYLFDEVCFAGNVADYYDPRNSMLHHVLRRRLGIPITLALVYVEVGARLGLPLVGIGMPGHFLVRHLGDQNLFIDPYNRGVMLSEAECAERLRSISDSIRWDRSFLDPVTNREFLGRMLRNLAAIWVQREELAQAVAALGMLIVLQPEEPGHRRDRGMLLHRLGDSETALSDLETYLELHDLAPDAAYVRRTIADIRESG